MKINLPFSFYDVTFQIRSISVFLQMVIICEELMEFYSKFLEYSFITFFIIRNFLVPCNNHHSFKKKDTAKCVLNKKQERKGTAIPAPLLPFHFFLQIKRQKQLRNVVP